MHITHRAHGFSLVELSIVLVILGLLTGGILAGQNLIRAAEIRSISTQFQSYVTAAQTFRDKYFALPGDMRNATAFWGEQASGTACSTTASTSQATCNGDGNGAVETTSTSDERYRIWQHLANAGLIEGSYSGILGPSSGSVIDYNVPRARLGNAGWDMFTRGTSTGSSSNYDMDYGNMLLFGAQTGTSGVNSPVLSPEEAWNLDTKMDDGRPAYGKVIAIYWNNLCASADDGGSASDDLEASYRLSDTSTQCALRFRHAF